MAPSRAPSMTQSMAPSRAPSMSPSVALSNVTLVLPMCTTTATNWNNGSQTNCNCPITKIKNSSYGTYLSDSGTCSPGSTMTPGEYGTTKCLTGSVETGSSKQRFWCA